MLTPATDLIADPIQLVEHEAGLREWQMVQALNDFCYAERSRAKMHAMLNEALGVHDFMVLDCSAFRKRRMGQ